MVVTPSEVEPADSGPFERWLSGAALILILLALMIRVPLLFNTRLGNDEAEHLHATWAVAHGQVPYRDFWQIHTPLLYYLMAPAFLMLGEDLRIIYVGRGLMLLCILLMLLQLYTIARACFDALTGLLAVLALSYLLLWWRPTYEFRPDIPQTLIVLTSLRRFMQAWHRRSRGEFLASGALLGGAFWLLTKTLFPLAGLTSVFVLSSALRRSAAAIRQNLTGLLLFLAAFAAPVALGGLLLWLAGALPNFLRWGVLNAFRYPDRFSALSRMDLEVHFVFFALALVGILLTVARMIRTRIVDEIRLSPLLVCSVTATVYLFLMPAPFPQSALPFLPLAAMYGGHVVRQALGRALPPSPSAPAVPGEAATPFVRSPVRLGWAVLTALLFYGVCVPPLQALLAKMPLLQDHWLDRRRTIRHVLALTSPDDSVFDAAGLYIFRPHATYFYRLAKGHLRWLQSGFINESEIIYDLQRNHCKVVIFEFAQDDVGLPPKLLRFLLRHYVFTGFRTEGGVVLVAGQVLHPAGLASNRGTVSLVASAEYAVRPRGGTPRVYIDGQLYKKPLFLTQGAHQIVVEGDYQEIAILYSRAVEFPIQ